METRLGGRKLGGRYVLRSLIAAGGMAEVWRGDDEVLGRTVAVKVLHPHLASDPALFDRFRMEAIASARLSHPAAVRVFDTGVDRGACFIVMEFLEGPTLADVLAARGPLAPGEALGIVGPVLDALGHAHRLGVVHRDVKPGNVLLPTPGPVKLADFGIARAAFAGGDMTTTGKLLGTAAYVAPEQVTGEEVDGRADLYAVGVMLYEMITGRRPFEGGSDLATATLRLVSNPVPPRALRAGIPRSLEEAVTRALSRRREDRFESAEEMRGALERAVPPSSTERVTAAPPASVPSFVRAWMLVPALVALLAGGAITAGLMLGRLEVGGPLLVRPADGTRPERPATLAVDGARDHDPQGDNRSENPEEIPLAFDGDHRTFWKTERYNSLDLGGAKDGVGIVFDLGGAREIGEVAVETTLPGWSFELHTSGDGASFEPIEATDGRRSFVAGETPTVVEVDSGAHRFVLLWITRLARDADGFRATVSEVRFSPPRD